jgi:uncharacterized membrane protein
LSTPVLHDPSNAAASEDRLMPAATYGLYFVGLFTALPIIVGAVMAYVMRGKSGPMAQSHYTYLIGTFWGAVLWSIVGIPVVALGYAMFGIVWCWILLRLVVGSIHVLRGEVHPRPRAWLL